MKTEINVKRAIATAGSALVLILAGCATQTDGRYIVPPAGSTWSSIRSDTGSFGSTRVAVTSAMGEQAWQGQKYNAIQSNEGTLLLRSTGDWVAQVRGSTPLVTWDPPVNWDYPLEIGKAWTKKSTVTIHAAKQTIPFEYSGKVEAYENIVVAAGSFWTYRVRTTDTLGNENTIWIAPELGIFVKTMLRRTAKHQQGPGTREAELVSQSIRK